MISRPIEKHLVIDSTLDLYYWYIPLLEVAMRKNGIAKLFRNGRSQAVRLPQEFRFEGDRVRIRRIDHGVLLEPLIPDAAKWFEEMDRFNQKQFMGKRRNQPITPRREIFE
jgi:antitoxin VapB